MMITINKLMIGLCCFKNEKVKQQKYILSYFFKKLGFASLQECEASLNPEEEQDPILWI